MAVLGSKRVPGYNVPTFKEVTGYPAGVESFGIVVGPPKIPKDRIEKLAKVWEVAVNDPEYQKFSIERNNDATFMPSDKLVKHLDEQRKIFRTVMEGAGILKEK